MVAITAWHIAIAIIIYVFGIWATCIYAGFVENDDLCLFSVIWPILLLLVAAVVTVESISDAWRWCIKKSQTLNEPKRKAVNVMCWSIRMIVKIVMFPFVLVFCPYAVGKWISRRLDEKRKCKQN